MSTNRSPSIRGLFVVNDELAQFIVSSPVETTTSYDSAHDALQCSPSRPLHSALLLEILDMRPEHGVLHIVYTLFGFVCEFQQRLREGRILSGSQDILRFSGR